MRWFTTCLLSHFLTSITTPAPKSSPSSYFVGLAPLHRLLSFPSPHPHYTLPTLRHQETFVSYFTNPGRYQDLPALATISLNDNVHLRARGFHSDLHSCYNHCRYPKTPRSSAFRRKVSRKARSPVTMSLHARTLDDILSLKSPKSGGLWWRNLLFK